ncbi:MAG: gamma-glutamyl-gamma-aminobutyrate hydrolase family protein [Lentisphaeria bacterium]|jgi:putative glutamine amidotransferase
MAKPLIGICCGLDPARNQLTLPVAYAEALVAACALPVLIPTLADRQATLAYCRRLDGVILSGGPDIRAGTYGGENHPAMTILPAQREDWDLALARELLAHSSKPLMGICLGCQEINVAAGGTLLRHIPDDLPGALEHRRMKPSVETWHDVELSAGTMLHSLLGSDSIRCNSSHHQAVDRLAAPFQAIAHSSDGVIEAFTLRDHTERFLLAVQWHPERIWRQPDQLKLFQALVAAC